MSWIDDLISREKTKEAEESKRDDVRLHNAKVISALFPVFWKEVVEQIEKDCLRLKKELPNRIEYHIHTNLTAEGFKLTREASPPLREILVQPNCDGRCIHISGGHTRETVSIVLKGENALSFTWREKIFTTPQELSRALIEYCASGD